MAMTPEEAKKRVATELDVTPEDPPDYPIWERVWCRLVGNHIWVPIYIWDVATNRVYEDGAVCERCYKEVT